ncbi:MAG: (deoxy)nucleoside triphosphate pyrophosphohydrolase [Lachnospiraceae bacterium]|nr:(deoxy)nucleoside triphosphate pyrophosphohydrolase [Lachnospiraceae bacterium]
MKTIKVVAAIIQSFGKDGESLVFATQRGYGEYKDWWEFPGGKIETGETPEEALVREIQEELAVIITVDRYLTTVEYDYPAFHLSMDCFWCSLTEGHLTLLEHEAAKWLPLSDLRQVDWLPADLIVIDAVENELQKGRSQEIGFEGGI